jgi:hypothetical protein
MRGPREWNTVRVREQHVAGRRAHKKRINARRSLPKVGYNSGKPA